MPGIGVINESVINDFIINGVMLPDGVISTGQGNLLSFTQKVGIFASGNLLIFKQQVTSFNIGEGDLLVFEQRVNAIASGNLLTISQIVTTSGSINPNPDSPIPHYIVRNGFYPVFTIGSYVWPDSQIYDRFTITGNESDSKQLVFSLLFRKYTAYGAIDFEAFDGAPVTLDIYSLSGSIDRIFTGRINKVDIDVMNGFLTCTCDDVRRDKIINEYAYQTQFIGYYDKDVQGEADDTFDLLEKRLSTVPQSVDVDRYGILQLSNIMPIDTPHFTFTDGDVYGNNDEKGDPKVEKLLRSRVVNTINISIDYQYQRRYHGNATYSWSWDTDVCEMILEGESIALKSTIESAIDSTGWVVNNPGITYTSPPADGLYNCSGFPTPLAFTTKRITGVGYEDVTDSDGNPITGIDGKTLKKTTGGTIEDSRDLLAIGADWHMSYRWTQNVKETYTLQITAPQSIAKYGVVSQSLQTGIDDSSDSTDWESYQKYQSPEGMSHEEDSNIYYLDYTPNRSRFYTAFFILINQAKTTILKAHRDNRVTFSIPLTPTLEMFHTVYLNCTRIQAYGKVVAITHNCNIADGDAYTKVTIALSRSIGSSTDSALNVPTIPTQVPPDPNWFIRMGSIYGEEPSDNFKGFVGNRWKTEDDYTFGFRGSNTYKTNVQEKFIVKAPDIGATYRDLLQLNSGGSYTMTIPNHTLSVNFL